MTQALLYVGYLPARTRAVETLAARRSIPEDVLRVGPDLRVDGVRRAIRFLNLIPHTASAEGRTVIIRMDGANANSQAHLLLNLEDPPATALFILTAPTLEDVIGTVRSRCVIQDFIPGDYGQRIKDLGDSGMEIERAAQAAHLLARGYSMETVPSEPDYKAARTLVEAGIIGEVEVGLKVAESFRPSTLVALREVLNEGNRVDALLVSHSGNYPSESATLALENLIKRGRK